MQTLSLRSKSNTCLIHRTNTRQFRWLLITTLPEPLISECRKKGEREREAERGRGSRRERKEIFPTLQQHLQTVKLKVRTEDPGVLNDTFSESSCFHPCHLCIAVLSSQTPSTTHIATHRMQEQVWEFSCLLFRQTLKRNLQKLKQCH